MSQDSNSDAFSISDSQIEFAGVLAYAATVPGTIVCGLVVIAYAVAALSPLARRCFDRVSFRLLVYSLVFNVLFGIAYAATPTSASTACNVGAFAVNLTLTFATFFTTCIAINLQLVLVHGVNGKKMEKYYVIITILLSLALNVPTFALGQFGWNDQSATCWYSNADDKVRLRWIIATQSFWISLAATIETICSTVVLFWMFRFQRSINSHMKAGASLSNAQKNSPRHTQRSFVYLGTSRSSVLSQDPRYRKIILRIALYPIISLFMNYSTVALDLNVTIVGMNTQFDFRLLVLDLILYGVRTLAYGVLAAGDPSFVNAIQEIRSARRKTANLRSRTITKIDFTPGTIQSSSTASGADVSKVESQVPEETHTDITIVTATPEAQDLESSRQARREIEADEIRNLERQL